MMLTLTRGTRRALAAASSSLIIIFGASVPPAHLNARIIPAPDRAAVASVAVQAQEPDILDAALAHPFGVTVNGAPVRFGDPDLDAAELALHDFLPRPWTLTNIRPLFEAAAARTARLAESKDDKNWGAFTESQALMVHLGSILADSRSPLAALALGRVLESQHLPIACTLASSLLRVFSTDSSYQSLPNGRGVIASTNLCPNLIEDAQRWLQLNRQQLETRAAAFMATAPPCPACEENAAATIEHIQAVLHATAPRLHVTVQGGSAPSFVQFEGLISPMSGQGGSTRSMQRLSAKSADILIEIPALLLGRSDIKIAALLISPGYQTVAIDVAGTRRHPVIPVTLTPLPTKRLTGVVTFANGTGPRRFVLNVDLRVTATNDSFGIFSNSMSTLQGIAQATVGADGRFTIVLPDLTEDHFLAASGNRFVLSARAALTLEPNEIEFDRKAVDELHISASSRTRRGKPGRSQKSGF